MNQYVIKELGKIRHTYDEWMKKREMEYPFPEDVECIKDLSPNSDAADWQKIDVYRPKQYEGKLPVIVSIHGGGMLLCTRKANRAFCAELAKRGFLVFCPDYPLVPESDIPGILRESALRLEEIRQMLPRFDGDAEHVYMVGDSAGAFIGLYELAAQKNSDLAGALNLTPCSMAFQSAVFVSGMYYTGRLDIIGVFLRKDFHGKDWKRNPFRPFADPGIMEVAGVLPPMFVATSKRDQLRWYTMDFRKSLLKLGIDHRFADLPSHPELTHDFVVMKPELPEISAFIDEMCQFLRQY